MAELAKKLYFKKNGTTETAKAYSTATEAGTEYITNKIDGITAYVAIGSTDDERATKGRVTKNGTKAILNSGKPPYTEKSWTTAGTYTFTVPQGVTRIRAAVCGGGAGAISKGNSDNFTASGGGNSSFGTISATGAPSNNAANTADKNRGYGGAGGTPNGRNGQIHYYADLFTGGVGPNHVDGQVNGGAGFGLSFTQENGKYGRGGGGYITSYRGCAGGGSGGYNTGYVDVTPNQTISVVVGAAGSNYNVTSDCTMNVNPVSGFVLIGFGGDI